MRQIAFPLGDATGIEAPRLIVGTANALVIDAFDRAGDWPFRSAILFGPPRSGKSLLARWFARSGLGTAIDDADRLPEADLFHRWNRAQESGTPLLLVGGARSPGDDAAWKVALPDLASRLGAALRLDIAAPDDAMLAELIGLHAEMRGLALDHSAAAYLVPRCERTHIAVETLVAAIDRLSLERKQPPTLSIWRDALDELSGGGQQRLL